MNSSSWATIPASKPLRGTVYVAGDKSITHRALILGALAEGETKVSGYCRGEDCLNTLGVVRALGISVQEVDDENLRILGKGLRGLTEPTDVLDCGNSGTGLRLLAGVLAGQDFFSVLTGDASLRNRPMGRVANPLRLMGASITGRKAGECAPLAITGQRLKGCAYTSPVASAQVKSSVLLAGLLAEGITSVTEPMLSRDHTERMFRYLGLGIEVRDCTVSITGQQTFQGKPLFVPGDMSAAAFFLVAGSIVPGSELCLPGIGMNPARTGILEVLKNMGADIQIQDPREISGEPVADLVVKSAKLKGVSIGPDLVPKTIDEFPILCVAAAVAEGETSIAGAQELRVKETDRIRAMTVELSKLGVFVEERPDGLCIKGTNILSGAQCQSYGDHRVAMSLAIAGLLAESPIVIDETDCIETSFPGFQGKLLDLLTNSH
ncbi:MAG: 3-phosphoshikimate 1-carboxyvinyltransferase [Nitrospirales bacterium]|nr:3-phosphoshikimate 1-carboxyvinyltransferase [Nitrospirales bacterium]